MNFSKEEYEYLSQFKPQFNTAIKSHFVRMDNRMTLAKLDSIYVRAFGKKSNLLGGCTRCVVDGMTKLGNAFYADAAEYEKEAQKDAKTAPIDLIDENCGTTITKTAKKPTAKKKTTKNKK